MQPCLFPACYLAANCFVEAWLPKIQLCISGRTGCHYHCCTTTTTTAAAAAAAAAAATTVATTTTTTANMAAAAAITFTDTTIALIVTRLIAISYNFLPLPKLVQEGRP